MQKTSRMVIALAAIGVLLVGCGDDQGTIPSAEDLSRTLLDDVDLDGDWTRFDGPQGGDEMVDPSGVLTEDQRDLVPVFEFCDEASDEAKAVGESLRPLVFRQLDLQTDDEINPPFDRSGHMIFLQEFLYADDPEVIAQSFDTIQDGTTVCFGDIPAEEEGPGRAIELELPDVGEDRLGVLITIEEAGGWAEWHIQEAIVFDGPILMRLVLVDIRAGVEPFFAVSDFAEIVRLADEKLSS